MFIVIRCAALFELGLQTFEHLFPALAHMLGLPLGGNMLAQLGVVFSVAFLIAEPMSMRGEARKERERRDALEAFARKSEEEERAAEEEKARRAQANDQEPSDDAA